MGTIGTISASKSDDSGMWSVSVSADIQPGAGESVYQQDYPQVEVLDSEGTLVGSFGLAISTGTLWAGQGDAISDPSKVKVYAKFVSLAVVKDADL